VPQYLRAAGVDVIPVPVFYPNATSILGIAPIYRRVADVPGPPVDIVDVFRKPSDLAAHLDDLLAARPGEGVVCVFFGRREDGSGDCLPLPLPPCRHYKQTTNNQLHITYRRNRSVRLAAVGHP
jgi:hypothetical protein